MTLEHEPNVQATINECIDLMQQFENMDLFPAQLLKIETVLTTRLTYLLGKKAEYQFNQNSAYWVRKIEHSRESIKARKTKEATSQPWADHIANERVKDKIRGDWENQ